MLLLFTEINSFSHYRPAWNVLQTRSSDEKAVRPSVRLLVCLSAKSVNCNKTKERSVPIFITYERLFTVA